MFSYWLVSAALALGQAPAQGPGPATGSPIRITDALPASLPLAPDVGGPKPEQLTPQPVQAG